MLRRLNTFYQLLKVDVLIEMRTIVGKLVDLLIWVVLSAFAYRYVFPELGMTTKYASLMATSGIVSMIAFELFGGAADWVADFNGDRIISYQLTLPLSSWELFLKLACGRMIDLMSQTIMIVPIFKLIIWDALDLTAFSPSLFAIAFLVVHVFGGCYSVWCSSLPDSGMASTTRIWTRLIFPLWYFGGTIFPYSAISSAFPYFSKLLLINPFVYATEGLRTAVLGTATSVIPFWISMLLLLVMALLLGLWGVARIKKRLDFI